MKKKAIKRINALYLTGNDTYQSLMTDINSSFPDESSERTELLEILNNSVLFGIIYNDKGLSEINSLIYGRDMQKGYPEAYIDTLSEGESEYYLAANKTFYFKRLNSKDELFNFLSGKYNSVEDYTLNDVDLIDPRKESPLPFFEKLLYEHNLAKAV